MQSANKYIATVESGPGQYQRIFSDGTYVPIPNVADTLDSEYVLRQRVKAMNAEIRQTVIKKVEQDRIVTMFRDGGLTTDKLAKIDYTVLSDNAKTEFYNPNYTMYIKSIIESIVGDTKVYESSIPEKIRLWLNHVEVISSGAYGRTISASIDEIDRLFAIKYSISPNVSLTIIL
jgi:hypothetical protein